MYKSSRILYVRPLLSSRYLGTSTVRTQVPIDQVPIFYLGTWVLVQYVPKYLSTKYLSVTSVSIGTWTAPVERQQHALGHAYGANAMHGPVAKFAGSFSRSSELGAISAPCRRPALWRRRQFPQKPSQSWSTPPQIWAVSQPFCPRGKMRRSQVFLFS